MKKQFFLSTIFAVLAWTSMAQGLLVVLSPVNLDSVTTSAALVTGQQQNGSGTWFSKPLSNKIGTNVWILGTTVTHQGSYQPVAHWVYSLGSDSDYQFKIIYSYDSLFSVYDSVVTEIVHTKPLPQPVDFISATPLSLLPKSGFKSTAASIGRPSIMFGLDATTFAATTDTVPVAFTSNFTDTIFFLSNIPGVSSPATRIYVRSLDGLSTDVSPIMNGVTPPIPTGATMNVTYTRTSNSVHIPCNVTSMGNGGVSSFQVTITDTTGPTVYHSERLVTSTGIINVDTNNLLSNHWYHVAVSTTNQYGLGSTSSFSFQTLNVSNPTVVASSGTSGFTDYTVIGYVNRHGTGDSSDIAIAKLQKNGLTVDSVVLPTSDTIAFHETNKPLNTNETVTIKVINKANLSGTSSSIAVQTTPVLKPSFTNNAPVKTQQSASVTVNITSLGNAGNPTFRASFIDAVSGAHKYDTSIVVTSTGLLTIWTLNVTSNHAYYFSDTLTNVLGVGDTTLVSFQTPNVNAPTATHTVTTTYTDYTIAVPIDPHGTWDSSAIKKTYLIEDNIVIDSVIGNTALANFHIYQRVPGAVYHDKVQVINLANLSTTTSAFNVPMVSITPDGIPSFSLLFADDASTLRVTNITYHVSVGNIAMIRILREDLMTGQIDTFTVVAGVTGSGTISSFTMTDCIGDHTYEITVFDENQYGAIVWGYYDQQGMPTPEPSGVISLVERDDIVTTSTTLGVDAIGSREGNDCILKFHLYNPAGAEIQAPPFAYTNLPGLFNQKNSWSGLMPGTQYKVITELIALGNTTVTSTDYFSTLPATGIEEIPLSMNSIKSTQMIRLWNLLGQEIGYGEFQNVHPLAEQSGARFVLAELYDEQGKPQGHGKLPLF